MVTWCNKVDPQVQTKPPGDKQMPKPTAPKFASSRYLGRLPFPNCQHKLQWWQATNPMSPTQVMTLPTEMRFQKLDIPTSQWHFEMVLSSQALYLDNLGPMKCIKMLHQAPGHISSYCTFGEGNEKPTPLSAPRCTWRTARCAGLGRCEQRKHILSPGIYRNGAEALTCWLWYPEDWDLHQTNRAPDRWAVWWRQMIQGFSGWRDPISLYHGVWCFKIETIQTLMKMGMSFHFMLAWILCQTSANLRT